MILVRLSDSYLLICKKLKKDRVLEYNDNKAK